MTDHPFRRVAERRRHRAWRPATQPLKLMATDPASEGHKGAPNAGQPVYEVVIGGDNRQPIANTQSYPARAIADLIVQFTDGTHATGTGWFIGPRTVITAAHVVTSAGRVVQLIAAAPGRNGNTLPFGFSNADKWATAPGWNHQAGSEMDFAAVELERRLGDQVGFFGIKPFSDAELKSIPFWIAGYPDDKPDGTMWAHEGPVAPQPSFLRYEIDTFRGQSGAPVFAKLTGGGFWAAGLHVGGIEGVENRAVRITAAVYAQLEKWKAGLA